MSKEVYRMRCSRFDVVVWSMLPAIGKQKNYPNLTGSSMECERRSWSGGTLR